MYNGTCTVYLIRTQHKNFGRKGFGEIRCLERKTKFTTSVWDRSSQLLRSLSITDIENNQETAICKSTSSFLCGQTAGHGGSRNKGRNFSLYIFLFQLAFLLVLISQLGQLLVHPFFLYFPRSYQYNILFTIKKYK